MEPLHQAILSELGIGRFQSQSRDLLRERVGHWLDRDVSDRELRAGIEWLRANDPQGAWIVSDSSWSGYWLAESLEEVEAHCKVTRTTAATLFQRARKQLSLARQAQEEPEQLRLIA